MDKFDYSYSKALESIYPEVNWQFWRFGKVPKHYWQNPKHEREFMDWLVTKLNIFKLEDWASVSYHQIRIFGGSFLLEKYGGLSSLVGKYFPDAIPYFDSSFLKSSKSQTILFKVIIEKEFNNLK